MSDDGQAYETPDMAQAWYAGARWVIDRAEIVDGELHIPHDTPGVEGWDWAEAFGSWIENYDEERGNEV